MTNLKNKKCLFETIEKLKNSDKNLSVAMIDMDNFKSINELFNHATGDEFIKQIGETIRKSNLDAYRFGGDEFIVLFSQNESRQTQEEAINNLLKNINKNLNANKIKDVYEQTAQKKIDMYSKSDEKIKNLQKNKCGQEILLDFKKNCKTDAAKNDDYLFYKLDTFSDSIRASYKNLLDESIQNEKVDSDKKMLKEMKLKINSFGGLKNKEVKLLDEYLIDKYDKTANISRIKSWQKDFVKHGGFCATCGIASFDKNYIKNKTTAELLGETSEILQNGKDETKGKCYYKEINSNLEAPSFKGLLNTKVIPIAQYRNNSELYNNFSGRNLKMIG